MEGILCKRSISPSELYVYQFSYRYYICEKCCNEHACHEVRIIEPYAYRPNRAERRRKKKE